MRELSEAFEAHLLSGATTLATLWRLTRRDGAILGFTDHDEAIHFEGVGFQPQTGFSASEAVESFGFNAEAGEVAGALSASAIRDEDIEKGLYDGARIETFRINWAEPTQHVLLKVETIGEIVRGDGFFRVELRGLRDELSRVRGRYFQRACDAVVGDGRCRANLDLPAFKASITITEIIAERRIRVSGLSGFAAGWFSGGALLWQSGDLAGLATRVRLHMGDELELEEAVFAAVGDGASVTAGCDKSLATCKGKFANHLNFQGFPHMPGDDFVLSYPTQGGGNDGRAIF